MTAKAKAKAKTKAKSVTKPAVGAVSVKAKSSTSASGVDVGLVRELAELLNELDLAEVEVKPGGKIRIVRRAVAAAAYAAPAVASAAHVAPAHASAAPQAASESKAAAKDEGTYIMSPFVGTFYRAPSPDAAMFTDVGQSVRKGQVVCIIEAMKLMNEIEAETDGKVVEVLVKNAEHVEYGQKLFRIVSA